MLSDLLFSLRDIEFMFNLFGYISFRSGLSLVSSFFIVIFLMPHWIAFQQRIFPSGQPIRDDGPQTHIYKKGTPALGGVLILFSIILSSILWTSNFSKFNYILILSLLLFGIIGFIDDYIKVKRKNKEGLKSRFKIIGQVGF